MKKINFRRKKETKKEIKKDEGFIKEISNRK